MLGECFLNGVAARQNKEDKIVYSVAGIVTANFKHSRLVRLLKTVTDTGAIVVVTLEKALTRPAQFPKKYLLGVLSRRTLVPDKPGTAADCGFVQTVDRGIVELPRADFNSLGLCDIWNNGESF